MTDLINTRNVRQDSLPLSGKYGPPKNDKVILIVVLGIIIVLKRVYLWLRWGSNPSPPP